MVLILTDFGFSQPGQGRPANVGKLNKCDLLLNFKYPRRQTKEAVAAVTDVEPWVGGGGHCDSHCGKFVTIPPPPIRPH